MENGTVQGYGWPALGWVPSWVKVTKFRVEPGFYDATLHTLINLKKWRSLTKAQQDLLTKIGLEFEARSDPDSAELNAALKKQKAWTASEGMQTITFSGADRDSQGLVRAADGGTLFLDEIAELSEPSQVALLRVLQEGEVLPVS